MNRHLLAMSALMSASAYFRLLPSRPATCSSIASFAVLLCAALVLEDMYAAPLCLPILVWRMSVDSRLAAFLLLVSGNLIRLEAVSGLVALAVVVGAAISPYIVAVAEAPSHDTAILMSGSSSVVMRAFYAFSLAALGSVGGLAQAGRLARGDFPAAPLLRRASGGKSGNGVGAQ
jgi:hypothetical protein